MAITRKKALAVEMLQGIRARGNRLNRAMRTELNNWSFAQLKSFLAYKCTRAGVPLIEVDARYSSQQCSRCAHTERANRPSQEVFRCRYCCFQSNADVNAALVLETRVTLSTGPRFYLAALASRGGQAVPPLGGGS
jgi:putative transposase